VSLGLRASVFAGRTGTDFSLSMLFPFIAALAKALYQIATRLLLRRSIRSQPCITRRLPACGGLLPLGAIVPRLADVGLMLFLGLAGVVSHFMSHIRAFAKALANIIAPLGYTALLWAALFSLLIFGEIRSPRTLFGAAMIVGSGLFIFLRGSKFPSRQKI
jgi:drug/metabolite transporter (DMT)-like permease